MKQVIVVKDLVKHYYQATKRFFGLPIYTPVRVLHNISFSVGEGEVVGYLGLNGAGKTTTIKILSGIISYDSGEVRVAGFDPKKREPEFFKTIGVLFGNRTNLIFQLPVIDSLELWKDVYGIEQDIFEERLDQLSKLLDLDEIIHVPVRKLSFGQRMRAEIASIFLHKPKVVFLDEPTLGIDILAKERIYGFLRKINKEEGTTILLTTHNLRDIEVLCERIIMLSKGRVVWSGKLRDLVKKVGVKKVRVELLPKDVEKAKAIAKHYGLDLEGRIMKGELERSQLGKFLNSLIRELDVLDLSVTNLDLEEVIRRGEFASGVET